MESHGKRYAFCEYIKEKKLNFGDGKLRKVMEKVMESHGIFKA